MFSSVTQVHVHLIYILVVFNDMYSIYYNLVGYPMSTCVYTFISSGSLHTCSCLLSKQRGQLLSISCLLAAALENDLGLAHFPFISP